MWRALIRPPFNVIDPEILVQWKYLFPVAGILICVLEIGYSGARGTHLIRQRSVNEAGLASIANPIRGVTTNKRSNIALRVPFQGFSSTNASVIESAGASWYNALLVGLNKRFSHGLRVQGSAFRVPGSEFNLVVIVGMLKLAL